MNSRMFLTFKEIKLFIKKYKFTSRKNYLKYVRKHDLRLIPKCPEKTYKKDWKGWGDYLGTNNVANTKRKFVTYSQAKKTAQKAEIFSQSKWRKWKERPKNVPSNPNLYYKKWTTWQDFFGKKDWPSFEEAKKLVRKYKIKSSADYRKRHNTIPELKRLPTNVKGVYG